MFFKTPDIVVAIRQQNFSLVRQLTTERFGYDCGLGWSILLCLYARTRASKRDGYQSDDWWMWIRNRMPSEAFEGRATFVTDSPPVAIFNFGMMTFAVPPWLPRARSLQKGEECTMCTKEAEYVLSNKGLCWHCYFKELGHHPNLYASAPRPRRIPSEDISPWQQIAIRQLEDWGK